MPPESQTVPQHVRQAEAPSVFDKNLVAALSHPLRIRILDVLLQRVASPREIAEDLGAKVGDVSYHVTKLRNLGAIELVRTEPRRGTLKHFYRAVTRNYIDDEHMKHIPLAVRRELFGSVLNDVIVRLREAAAGTGFDRPDAHVSSTPLDLDVQGHEEVVALLTATMDRAMVIQSECLGRRSSGESPEDERIRTEMTLLHYVIADGPRHVSHTQPPDDDQ